MTATEEQAHKPSACRVFVIGATGGIGQRVVTMLRERGHEVSGMHRPRQQDAILRAGGTPVQGDLVEDSVEQLTGLMAGHDAIIFCAGAQGSNAMTTAVDGEGAEHAADAAAAAGVQRFVLISVFPDAQRGNAPSESFEHYVSVKRAADVHLASTNLDWLIVRPGTLTDTPGTGLVDAASAVPYLPIPRDDVAAFIASSVLAPKLNRVAVELTAGDLSIDQAIARLRPRIWEPTLPA